VLHLCNICVTYMYMERYYKCTHIIRMLLVAEMFAAV